MSSFIKDEGTHSGSVLEGPPKKEEAFVVMQIGNAQMDRIWKSIYEPTIKKVGLGPRRVDIHDDGTLLKQQIIQYLNQSQIIIADLSNQRPNCYLEVGYVMGQNRYRDLILCCREDHNRESPNHKEGGPKVHFDLEGYTVLWWDPRRLGDFARELEDKIRRRMGPQSLPAQPKLQVTPPAQPSRESKAWIEEQRKEAFNK